MHHDDPYKPQCALGVDRAWNVYSVEVPEKRTQVWCVTSPERASPIRFAEWALEGDHQLQPTRALEMAGCPLKFEDSEMHRYQGGSLKAQKGDGSVGVFVQRGSLSCQKKTVSQRYTWILDDLLSRCLMGIGSSFFRHCSRWAQPLGRLWERPAKFAYVIITHICLSGVLNIKFLPLFFSLKLRLAFHT